MEVLKKDVEITWCWDIFDRIEATIQSNTMTEAEKLSVIKWLTKQGLKGRKN
jgi:hypothetical protein